jgi:hypothetical protein
MYLWYHNSSKCYAYLSDVGSIRLLRDFRKSEWFTRGWTLQELIAPSSVEFYTKDWVNFGTRLSLNEEISEITSIDASALCGGSLETFNIAQKMSWAANRNTSRPEDMAYCLMGIFNVNMSLLYGEGEENAFLRLQKKIMKVSEDHTLFLWHRPEGLFAKCGLLAVSPRDFRLTEDYDPSAFIPGQRAGSGWESDPPRVTSRGLRIHLCFLNLNATPGTGYPYEVVALLDVVETGEGGRRIGVTLQADLENPKCYRRKDVNFSLISIGPADSLRGETIFVSQAKPAIVEFSPAIPTSSFVLISDESRCAQLLVCHQYGLRKRKETILYPDCRQGKEHEWEQALWASPSDVGITNALFFNMPDENGQPLGYFSIRIGILESFHPWCDIRTDLEEQQNRECMWNIEGGDLTSDALLTRGAAQSDHVQKVLNCGRKISAVVRRRAHMPGDPPIPEMNKATLPVYHWYLYTLHISITALPVPGESSAQNDIPVPTRCGRVLDESSIITAVGSQFKDLSIGHESITITEVADVPSIWLPCELNPPTETLGGLMNTHWSNLPWHDMKNQRIKKDPPSKAPVESPAWNIFIAREDVILHRKHHTTLKVHTELCPSKNPNSALDGAVSNGYETTASESTDERKPSPSIKCRQHRPKLNTSQRILLPKKGLTKKGLGGK